MNAQEFHNCKLKEIAAEAVRLQANHDPTAYQKFKMICDHFILNQDQELNEDILILCLSHMAEICKNSGNLARALALKKCEACFIGLKNGDNQIFEMKNNRIHDQITNPTSPQINKYDQLQKALIVPDDLSQNDARIFVEEYLTHQNKSKRSKEEITQENLIKLRNLAKIQDNNNETNLSFSKGYIFLFITFVFVFIIFLGFSFHYSNYSISHFKKRKTHNHRSFFHQPEQEI